MFPSRNTDVSPLTLRETTAWVPKEAYECSPGSGRTQGAPKRGLESLAAVLEPQSVTCWGHTMVLFQVEIDYFPSWREGGAAFPLRGIYVKQWKTHAD